MKELLEKLAFLGLLSALVLFGIQNSQYRLRVKELETVNQDVIANALKCGAALEEVTDAGYEVIAEVIMLQQASKECLSLIDRASEGLDTCMANVEFFKELAAYNESNLDTCLYDLRIERGQRTDGN